MMNPSPCANKPWLIHYEPGVPDRIDYDRICLPEIFDATAESYSEKAALSFQGYQITYRDLKRMVDRFAVWLNDFGVERGDRAAILLPNLIPCVAAYFAILKIGAIAVMNNPLYTDRELEHQFNDSGSSVLITLDLLCNRMIDLRPKTGIRQIVYTTIGDYLPFPKSLLFKIFGKKKKLAAAVKPAEDVYRWKDVFNSDDAAPAHVDLSFEDDAMFQYTGGTTGTSKGAVLTHGNLSVQVQQLRAWFPGLNPSGEIMLGALPFFHVFGLTTSMNFSIYMAWTNILVPRPQPDVLLETIRKYRPTFAPMVPTMYIGMLNHPDIRKTDITSIDGCFSGSSPLPVEVIESFERKTGAVIVEGYGLTEASPVTHVNPFAAGKRKIGSIGVPVSDTICRIVDLDDGETDVPIGESGELLIQGPQIMKGYRNMPDETASTLRGGWLYTGDIAKMDEDGYFYIIDRKKDMIISGGYNIYPRDVEEVFYEHPKVKEACCIGIPHARRGEAVKVFVVCKEGQTAHAEELMEFCGMRLAKYKLPEEIEFRVELPKTNVGKIHRKALKEEDTAKRSPS